MDVFFIFFNRFDGQVKFEPLHFCLICTLLCCSHLVKGIVESILAVASANYGAGGIPKCSLLQVFKNYGV
jgi:hypothetical protein